MSASIPPASPLRGAGHSVVGDVVVAPAAGRRSGYTLARPPGTPQVFVVSREAAVEWAGKIAAACRCSQELREFQYDPES